MSLDCSTTLRISEQMDQAIKDIVDGSRHAEDVPEMSRSEVLRRLLSTGLDYADDISDLVSEETRILLARQEFKDREAKVRNLRTGFETRVKDNFTRRFRNGYDAEQLTEFAANMRQEARILWPDYLIEQAEPDEAEQMRQRRQECIDYVDAVVEAAVDAVETSEHDPLDPESMFESFGGVEAGLQAREAERMSVDDDLLDDAIRMLTKGSKSSSYSGTEEYRESIDPETVIERLSQRTDVTEAEAERVAQRAAETVGIDASVEGVVADD